MANNDVISASALAARLPVFCSGIYGRLKGLRLASTRLDKKSAGLGLVLEQAVRRNPKGTAICYQGRQLSYHDFNAWVNRLANYLAESGTRKGDVVALFIENRPELLACVAALAKIGAVSALLNTSQRGKVLRHSMELVSAKRAIVGEELFLPFEDVVDLLPDNESARLYLADRDTLESSVPAAPGGWVNLAVKQREAAAHNPRTTSKCLGSDPLCYFYTSGTTGLPKAAVLTNGRFMKAYAGVGLASLQFRPSDRVYVSLPFYHGTALIVGWGSVLAGAAGLVLARQFSASSFWDEVRRDGVTAFCYVGELCRYLMAQPESSLDRQHKVRVMFGNGLRPNIWKAFKQRFGIDRVMEFYGSSEGNVGFLNLFNFDCTVGFTTVPYAIVQYDHENEEPIRGHDGFMRKVKRGEAGLLLGEISDKTPYDGYTDQQKTEQTILRNVFRTGDAWFNTGDLMRDQGFRHAQFVDRLGDTFRWKGENVSTTEVENVLSSREEVIDAVVYGVEINGTNGRAGMACLRLRPETSMDPKVLAHYLRQQLPPYAVPVFLRFVDEMATTGTFKYQKSALKAEGFDTKKVPQTIWVLLPGSDQYRELDASLQKEIEQGRHRF